MMQREGDSGRIRRQYNDYERPMTQRQLRDQLAIESMIMAGKYGISRTTPCHLFRVAHMFAGTCMFPFVCIMYVVVARAICRILACLQAAQIWSACFA